MIKIGVSACLLGQNVRYDGKNKFANLAQYFDPNIYKLIPICPEIEMGMSVPRAPIQIINNGDIKLVQADNHSIDYTPQMESWFNEQETRISEFTGFILKSKSPSCGNQTTTHYSNDNQIKLSDGLLVSLLKQNKKQIPIIDETNITSPQLLFKFKKDCALS